MLNAIKGAALAAGNAVALAMSIALSFAPDHHWFRQLPSTVSAIALLAMFSSIPLGAVLGVFAGKLRDNRLVVLELVTLALVPITGMVTIDTLGVPIRGADLCGLSLLAACPTVISVIVLERWTRPRKPIARALELRASA
jgi:hypothetical protein